MWIKIYFFNKLLIYFFIFSISMNDREYIEYERPKRRIRDGGFEGGMCALLLMFCTNFILIIFKLTLFILSLIYCFSEIKIFYVLNMSSIILAILYFLLHLSCNCGDNIISSNYEIILKILIFIIFIYDSICYYFYFYEGISQLSPLIVLIINDVLFTPSIFLIFIDCCCDNCCL